MKAANSRYLATVCVMTLQCICSMCTASARRDISWSTRRLGALNTLVHSDGNEEDKNEDDDDGGGGLRKGAPPVWLQ